MKGRLRKKDPQLSPQNVDHAWAAGVIDGEGCICIKKNSGRYYALHVIVGQSGKTRPKMLAVLQQHYGGNVSSQATPPPRTKKWAWQVVGANAERVLRQVLPYLVQKQDQALVALRHRQTILKPGQRVTEEHKAASEECYQALRNMKGYRKRHGKWRVKDV